MHINQLKESKFLKKEDCGTNGILVTIAGVEQHNVSKSGAPEELKYCLIFEEDILPLVLNSTNSSLIASITGFDDTDNWPGCKVVLFNDPTVMYAGKITGGIRVRAPRKPAAPPQRSATAQRAKPTPASEPEPEPGEMGEDSPF